MLFDSPVSAHRNLLDARYVILDTWAVALHRAHLLFNFYLLMDLYASHA